jgi:mono/diheme cytochrome c family protein
MAEVTGNLAGLPDSDVAAIATYVISIMGEPDIERKAEGERLRGEIAKGTVPMVETASANAADTAGETIYRSACASCHESGRPPPFGGLDFRLSTAIQARNPQNIINVTLFGLPPADGEASAVMPAFASTLDDQQIADLLAFMRMSFSRATPWADVTEMVRRTRSGEHKVAIRPADGIERAPQNVGAKE